jgi:hypothetical protein
MTNLLNLYLLTKHVVSLFSSRDLLEIILKHVVSLETNYFHFLFLMDEGLIVLLTLGDTSGGDDLLTQVI